MFFSFLILASGIRLQTVMVSSMSIKNITKKEIHTIYHDVEEDIGTLQQCYAF